MEGPCFESIGRLRLVRPHVAVTPDFSGGLMRNNIPDLDLEAANLAQIIDAVLEKKTAIARSEEAGKSVYADLKRDDAANSADGAVPRVYSAQRAVNEASGPGDNADISVDRLREDLASLTTRREQLLKALEEANRKAAIGELSAELTDLTGKIENQLVRYAALMHLTKGTPLGLLSITSLYGRESKQRAQQMVNDIKRGWRQG